MDVIRVKCKKTKNEIWIKNARFNPTLHEKIRGFAPVPRHIAFPNMNYVEKAQIVANAVEAAVKRGEEKAIAEKSSKVEKEIDKKANKVYTIEELEKLKFFELKKVAKELGAKITSKSTKADILAQLSLITQPNQE